MNRQNDQPPFLRASISLFNDSVIDDSGQAPISCLADLIRHNAVFNPDHLFALQSLQDSGGALVHPTSVTFLRFGRAVEQCCEWILSNLSETQPAEIDRHGFLVKSKPVALFLESDLGLFIYLASLLTLQVPVLLLSTRLSPAAISHLLARTQASFILVSPRTLATARATFTSDDNRGDDHQTDGHRGDNHQGNDHQTDVHRGNDDQGSLPKITVATAYEDFLTPEAQTPLKEEFFRLSACRDLVRDDDTNVVILHSSGTTGMPKPIHLAHRYILGYASCHEFPIHEDESRRGLNLSTLPLFHGFGALAPCLSLSVGKPVFFPPSTTITSGSLVIGLVKQYDITSLMTVPSITEELTCLPDFDAVATVMARLDMVIVGGGGLKPSVGKMLHSKGVTILNHFGATELGALAPIFRPGPDYDYRYLRIRNDLGLRLEYVEEEGLQENEDGSRRCKLTGYPFGWEKSFELQDNLICNPLKPTSEVRILNRMDDLIVLATGEKVQPSQLERALEQVAGVKRAIAFGNGREEIGVLVEPDLATSRAHTELATSLWPHILDKNKSLDGHARVSSPAAVIIKPADKQFTLTDKGSISRKEIYTTFEPEINAAYEALQAEGSSDASSVPLDNNDPRDTLRQIIQTCLPDHIRPKEWSDDEDLIHLGLDSLQATRLRRILCASLERSHRPVAESLRASPEFIYAHPSVSKLATALSQSTFETTTDVAGTMWQLASKYHIPESEPILTLPKAVVLLSGSTGTLGAHLLHSLSANPQVERIICMVRPMSSSKTAGTLEALKMRQRGALDHRSITIPEAAWGRISFVPWQPGADRLGISQIAYAEIVESVTHIFHGAWPMDFQRKLSSFEPMIRAVRDFIQLGLAIRKARPQIPLPRLLVASSIAVVGEYPEHYSASPVPETVLDDTSVPLPMGYSEAKWVCEKIVQSAHENLSADLTSALVRIGQVSGARSTGFWSPNEHIPFLVQMGKKLGTMPDLQGTVSWTPVDLAALAVQDLLLMPTPPQHLVYHLENPVRQSWPDILSILEKRLGLSHKSRTPFSQWLARMSADEQATSLVPFFTKYFVNMSAGKVRLDVQHTLEVSKTLRSLGGVEMEVLERYVGFWEKAGLFG
ncbi:MAG: hypothetical protein Q9166_004186 [cf. Caloplaca sp. 2 TL-2023]